MSKILLIEDNESNRDLLSRYLALFEYDVIEAFNGREGLEVAHDRVDEIGLILMDMNLPEIDGWEVSRRLKADAVTQQIPIIAITGHAMLGDREKACAAGCDDYATKPIDFNSLLEKIASYLARTNADHD